MLNILVCPSRISFQRAPTKHERFHVINETLFIKIKFIHFVIWSGVPRNANIVTSWILYAPMAFPGVRLNL